MSVTAHAVNFEAGHFLQVEICLKNSLPQTAKPQASPAGTEQSARGGGRGRAREGHGIHQTLSSGEENNTVHTPPGLGRLGLRTRQRPHPGSGRRGRRQCQEGTVGGGGRPSHHPAPGEGRQPRLPPGGPAATSSHPENPGVRETADGAEPAGCLPRWSSSIPVQGRASHPDPLYTSPERPRPTGPRLPAVRPPSGPSKAAFTSPLVSAAAAGTTTLSVVRVPPAAPSSAAGPVPFTPLPPKPREGGGSGAEGAG